MSLAQRRALLVAALAAARVQVADRPPVLQALHRWLDSWPGLGAVVVGMCRQGFDVDLMSVGPDRRQATFLATNPTGISPLVAGYAEQTTPWAATQQAAWEALRRAL